MDEAYESMDEDDIPLENPAETEEDTLTPKAHPVDLPLEDVPESPITSEPIPSEPTSDINTCPFPTDPEEGPDTPKNSAMTPTSRSGNSTTTTEAASLKLLTSLRHSFQRTEQNLYLELARTPVTNLNDVRRSFLTSARGAKRRICAWETKHSVKAPPEESLPTQIEPEWFASGNHAVPGANIIVRENDWGSIIAFTLSSADYRQELASMTINRPPVAPAVPPPTPAADSKRPSLFSRTVSSKWFPSAAPQPDPDEEGAVWHEPEAYSAVISRKEHPRDPASLLTLAIPDLLRPKHLTDHAVPPPATKFTTIGSSGGKGTGNTPPPSAWAKPDVQMTMQAADGRLSGASAEAVDRMMHDLEVASTSESPVSRREASVTESQQSSSGFETNIRRGKASSLISADSDTSTIGPPSDDSDRSKPPPPPPKDAPGPPSNGSAPPNGTTAPPEPLAEDGGQPQPQSSSTFTSSLTAALRYMVKSGPPPPPPVKYHHGLLGATLFPAIDERPHIKYDFTIGKRLKFSCTVYYAKQFDSLRRRCGIEDVFLHSLSRCENWAAQGGKSRSNFWKTSDDQFIVKSLVNAWNVADL